MEGTAYDEYLKAEGPEGADRIENVKELITGAAEQVADEEGEVGLTPLDHFLQKAMLVAELDKLGPDADAVTMMTLHNAKGLEFPVVFITGLEDGLFPLAKAYDDPAMLEEERRLFYVGITRAERKLFLTHAEQRRRNGEFMPSKASSFLQAIPEEMLEQVKTIKVRSSGRSFMHSLGGGSQWGNSRARGVDHPAREQWLDKESAFPPSASQRRPGTPVTRVAKFEEAEESQDAAIIAIGSRVKAPEIRQRCHRRAGGSGPRPQGEDRLRRSGDRTQDARRGAGQSRAGYRVVSSTDCRNSMFTAEQHMYRARAANWSCKTERRKNRI